MSSWTDAALGAALLAIDPVRVGGVALRAQAGPVRDRWLSLLRKLWPPHMPLVRVPLHTAEDRLIGGLDLAATLSAGRVVAERGLLAVAHGGAVIASMAERLEPSSTAQLASVLDLNAVRVERDGISAREPAQLAVIALDEGVGEDEQLPNALRDRLAIHLDLDALAIADVDDAFDALAPQIVSARERLPQVRADLRAIEALCSTALLLGVSSLRAPIHALSVARAAAALRGQTEVDDGDLQLAARLVLGPRATTCPATPPQEPPQEPPQDDPQDEREPNDPPDDETKISGPLEDVVLDAARSALPPGLLASLSEKQKTRAGSRAHGAGAATRSTLRGRPIGARNGTPNRGRRLAVIETLRAAAPWQPLRRRERPEAKGRVQVRAGDFHIKQYKMRKETIAIFVVDASGSSAMQRLAEAKGAVEQVLADCYVRRDHVALLAFRGTEAQLLLPPTKSLARAKKQLRELPGGGTTPLAAGLDAALACARGAQRRGQTPMVILMTDGRANIARDGSQNRTKAESDARSAGRALRAAGITVLFVDTAPRARAQAAKLASEIGARYLPLPHGDAKAIALHVQSAKP